jgi:hypothetical protein
MIVVGDPALYDSALSELRNYALATRRLAGEAYKGRFVQIFLGMKFWQGTLPTTHSGQYISAGQLQQLLDDLYAKTSRPANECVSMVFDRSHLALTGLIGVGNTTPQNTWRNNLHLQKGVGCYASVAELDSVTFLNQSRLECRHLRPRVAGQLNGATCELALGAPQYRNEDHRKWLRIHPAADGFAALDLMLTVNFAPWVAPAEQRVPILPLIVALYHDADPSLPTGQRGSAPFDVVDFATDFNFSPGEVNGYFDLNPANRHNAALLASRWGLSYTPFGPVGALTPAAPPIARPGGGVGLTGTPTIPAPVLTSTLVTPPVATEWWNAEQAVADHLESAGWTVYYVSRQQLGYDLLVQRGAVTRYVEVKSSSGYCSPDLTAREWQQAKTLGSRYVLAILENFDPAGQNSIYWVTDPATKCVSRPRTSTSYPIPRWSWTAAVVSGF